MRGRSRNNNTGGGGGNKGPNPLTRSYECNGPDVKIRGTAQHIAEKYSQLARDAHSSGDPVAAENYYQHAEHYIRIIAAAQEVLREQYGYQPRSFEDEGDEEAFEQRQANGDDGDPSSQPQPFEARQDGDRRPRYDRQDRGGQDRGSQDRGDRQDRNDRQDRDRQNAGDRQDRGDRQSTGDRRTGPIATGRTVTGRIAASVATGSHGTAHLAPNSSGRNSPGWISTAANASSGMTGRRLRRGQSGRKGLKLLRHARNGSSGLPADGHRAASRRARKPISRQDFRPS